MRIEPATLRLLDGQVCPNDTPKKGQKRNKSQTGIVCIFLMPCYFIKGATWSKYEEKKKPKSKEVK